MNILLTGSVAYDYLMTFPGHFKEQILPDQLESISLSFLVDSLVRRRGGIATNIAYNMALLGGRPSVLATVGEDFEDYRAFLESRGVDTSLMSVVNGASTASYFATTDQLNAQIASFYPGAMGFASHLSIRDLDGGAPDLVVISPNDPAAMEKYVEECRALGIKWLYDPSQQVARVNGDPILRGIEGAHSLFVNEYEYSLVEKKTGLDRVGILDHVGFLVVTRGVNGSDIYQGTEEVHVPAVLTDSVLDPTGGGDAYRGGFLTGYSRGWDWDTCGRLGSLNATYCLESDGPQGHYFTRQEFVDRYRQHFDDGGLLDALLEEQESVN